MNKIKRAVLLISFFLCLPVFFAIISVKAATTPVASYSLNETSGVTAADSSGFGNNGTLTNGPLWVAGKYNNALSFDGANDYVDLGSPASLDNVNTFSYCAWVNPKSMGGQKDARILHKGSNTVRKQFQIDSDITNSLALHINRNTTEAIAVSGANALTLNQWQYVCATYSETDGPRIYKNGAEITYSVRNTGAGPTSDESSQNFYLGNRPTADKGWDGLIDDVRIYNRILTTAEMVTDMNTPLGSTNTTPTLIVTNPIEGSTSTGSTVNVSYTINGNQSSVNHIHFTLDSNPEVTENVLDGSYIFTGVPIGQHHLHSRLMDNNDAQIGGEVVVNFSTDLPPNLINELVVTNLTTPESLEFLPDGRMIIGTFDERILIVQPGATQPLPTPALQISTTGINGEQGLYDIAVDKNFSQNGFIYISYTRGSVGRDRLSRFTMTGNTIDPASEFVIYQNTTVSQSQHHGGGIAFGNDGKIYLSTGERDIPADAQSLTNPNGKILRLNFDGTIPADNPFNDGNGPNIDAIWAYGLRNPFRTSIDPVTGNLYIGDVGGDVGTSSEEVNLGAAGANYGWPNCDGPCSVQGVTNPIYSYLHGSTQRDASITAGFIYRGTQFPTQYQGSYVFADYAQNWIRRLTFTSPASTTVDQMFYVDPPNNTLDDASIGDPVDIKMGPDGWIYYIDFDYAHRPDHGTDPSPVGIRRLRYAGNLPPVAVVSANPTIGPAPLDVNFSSVGTNDPEGDSLTYNWDFGDGQTSTNQNPPHTYAQNGPYTATLTVKDATNTTISNNIHILVGSPPQATILTPADNSTFKAGDNISISGSATDTEDQNLPDSAFSWTIEFLHDSHVHPGGTTNGTKTINLPISTSSGHNFNGFTRYRITLTVTDSDGLQDSKTITIFPQKVNLNFSSTPNGQTIKIDGVSFTTPFVFDTIVNYQHSIEAVNSSQYTFSSWNDGGAQIHTITVPNQDTPFSATFTQIPIPTGLISAYAFNETSGTSAADKTPNHNNGTLTNGPLWVSGKYGNALSFDGANDYVTLGSPSTLDNVNTFSYCSWVYPKSMGGQKDARILHKGSSTQRKQFQIDSGITNSLALYVDRNTTDANAISTANALTLNQWQYVCATYSESAGPRLYKNGVELSYSTRTVGAGATSDEASQNFYVGDRSTADRAWDGFIDEIRIYNKILTVNEMTADMNTPL